jgi:RNA-binding protein
VTAHDTLHGLRRRAPPVSIRFPFMPPINTRPPKGARARPATKRGSGRPPSASIRARNEREKAAPVALKPRRATPARVEADPRPLTASQKRYLRGLAHDLKAVILVGQKGVTPALLQEFSGALAHHELIKVKLADDDREARTESIEAIVEHSGAELVQTIGKVACFYKRNPDKAQFTLPK